MPGVASRHKILVAAGLTVLFAAGAGFYFLHRPKALTERDTILIADFANTTGDAVFDGTLKQALAVQLGQSPFLNIFPEQRVREALRFMGRSPDERLTSDVAREVCLREGVKALLTGTIAALGSQYVVTLRAVNAQTGDVLANTQSEAADKEQVLKALGEAASQLRGKLGESLGSIQKFDKPLEQATTSSLEALKAFSLGQAQHQKLEDEAATPFLKRAVELDPNFALAHATLGTAYNNRGQSALATEELKKAFELRDRVSERERLYITAHYYDTVEGQLDKTIETYELWKQTYARDTTPVDNLALYYSMVGQHEKAVVNCLEALRINPHDPYAYQNLAGLYLVLNRTDELKAFAEQAAQLHLDSFGVHGALYLAAFAQGDTVGMQRHRDWAKGKPDEPFFEFFDANTAASAGLLKKARPLFQQAIEMSRPDKYPEVAANFTNSGAFIEAEFGNVREAREAATKALGLARAKSVMAGAAITLARTGDTSQAQTLADELSRQYPNDTLLANAAVPAVRAELELNRNNPIKAIELLRPAVPYEFGSSPTGSGYLTNYVRGRAYLQAKDGSNAATEFQKILARRMIFPIDPLLPLSQLGLARAAALSGDTAKARKSYQDFLALWKDADPDIPIFQQAKAEYAKIK